MKSQLRKPEHILWLTLCLILALATYLVGGARAEEERLKQIEVERMTLPDTLRVLTLSGATTYFTIQQEQMGYQYELLRLYSQHTGIPFTIQTAPSLDSLHLLLSSGTYHLSITPEPTTKSGQNEWRFTGPAIERSMVLVQRQAQSSNDSTFVRNVTELIGKPLYVLSGTHYEQRLHHLGAQLGQKLDVRYIEDDTSNVEDLIAQVATDSIRYAIVDSELARLAHTYYPNIDYSLEVGFPQRMRWITTDRYEGLALSIDAWAKQTPNLAKAKTIYQKYFEVYKVPLLEPLPSDNKSRNPRPNYLPPITKGSISPFDALFRAAAARLPWSWHLLAAIAYQESTFRPEVIAWSGARGLMGIMPATGRNYGVAVDDLLRPEVSIQVAVHCLLDNANMYASVRHKPEELLCFTLASYNAGGGHIQDAQRLCAKYGGNPNSWTDVERYILLKSERKYYTDPVCKHGYLRGKETFNYVREVRERYHAYRGS